jgi:hypothetical protein
LKRPVFKLKAGFKELIGLAVGLAFTIPPETASIPQREAIRLLEQFLARVPPSFRR